MCAGTAFSPGLPALLDAAALDASEPRTSLHKQDRKKRKAAAAASDMPGDAPGAFSAIKSLQVISSMVKPLERSYADIIRAIWNLQCDASAEAQHLGGMQVKHVTCTLKLCLDLSGGLLSAGAAQQSGSVQAEHPAACKPAAHSGAPGGACNLLGPHTSGQPGPADRQAPGIQSTQTPVLIMLKAVMQSCMRSHRLTRYGVINDHCCPKGSGAVLSGMPEQGTACLQLLLRISLGAGKPPSTGAARDTGAQGEGKHKKSSKKSRRDQEMPDLKVASTTATQVHSSRGSNAACASQC